MKLKVILFLLLFAGIAYSQGNQPDRLVRQSELGYVNVKNYGATGNGITNDATVLASIINANAGKIIYFPNGDYLLGSTVAIDLNDKSIKFVFDKDTKFISTAPAVSNTYIDQVTEGCFTVTDGDVVEISGLTIEASNGDTISYQNALAINNCNRVVLDNVTAKYAGNAGIQIYKVNQLFVTNCNADSNLYAGLMVSGTKQTTVLGGSYSYNGIEAGTYGYGITMGHRFETTIDNENISIQGVKANYNFRKGIDVHGGLRISITGNFVKGFCYGGIYAVNEDDHVVTNYEFITRDVIISDNIIENDSAWYNGLSIDGGQELSHPIQVGNYSDSLSATGSFKIDNNIIRDVNVSNQRAIISVFAGGDSTMPIKSLSITNNSIMGVYSTYTQGIIYVNGTIAPAEQIIIMGNNISGTALKGIEIESGDNINIANNTMVGTIDTAVYLFTIGNSNISNNSFDGVIHDGIVVYSTTLSNIIGNNFQGDVTNTINVNRGSIITSSTNTLNGTLLLDMDSEVSGNTDLYMQTSTTADTIQVLHIDVSEYPSGSASFDIEIQVVGHDTVFRGTYFFNAYASIEEDTATVHFGVDSVMTYSIFDSSLAITYKPNIYWDGAGTDRILSIECSTQYTGYYIMIRYITWRLRPLNLVN